MFIREGRVSLACFLLTFTSFLIFFLPLFGLEEIFKRLEEVLIPYLLLHFFLLAFFIRLILRKKSFQVGIRAWLLGVVFSMGVFLFVKGGSTYCVFGWYMCLMSFFHWSEYVTLAWTNPESLSLSSYMLRHSPHYMIAAVASWMEFWIEYYFYPGMKNMKLVSLLGLTMSIAGEFMRKLAMITAMTNFNHIVQEEKKQGHVLVTHGIYSICRHPSYVGWFYWAVGTQIVLCNPFCTVGYALASWLFFSDRITIEEVTLLNFFQQDYIRYQKSVPTGLPFIKGFIVDDQVSAGRFQLVLKCCRKERNGNEENDK